MHYTSFKNTLSPFVLLLLSVLSHGQEVDFSMTQIGDNNLLDVPLDLNYGPDDRLWVTEKSKGTVVRIDQNTAERDELVTIPDAFSSGGQDGLLGLAFDNGFLSGSPFIYVSYSVGSSLSNIKQRLVRYTFDESENDGSLIDPVILIDNLPASDDHNSGKLVFGADGKLYYTLGDLGNKVCATNLAQFLPTQQQIAAKDWSRYPGKILRLNSDGSIPEDNPLIDGVRSHIYSYGHRNPQGLVQGSNGILYSSEHGPSSDDEVNIINAGMNYGWPKVAGYRDNLQDGAICEAAAETAFTVANYQDPIMSLFIPTTPQEPNCNDSWMCRKNIAPSGMDIYESDAILPWKNSLLVTSLKRGRIYRLPLNGDGSTVDKEDITQHFYTQNRYRDIVVSPDGKSIFIITDSSGKTSNEASTQTVTGLTHPGSILKFTLNENLSIGKGDLSSSIKIWPNPAKDVVYVRLSEKIDHSPKAELYNSLGQLVTTFNRLDGGTNSIAIEELPAGVYVLKIFLGSKSVQKQVVVY